MVSGRITFGDRIMKVVIIGGVAGGMSARGVGKLIFMVGKVNAFAYSKSLDFYREDIDKLGDDLYFQQEGAKSRTCAQSMEKIEAYFPKKLKFWPANSPGNITKFNF
jgi:hypothetical protein